MRTRRSSAARARNNTGHGIQALGAMLIQGCTAAKNNQSLIYVIALADPAQPALIDCTGRLQGYVWGENVGWINLDDEAHFVAMNDGAAPQDCDVNDDGDVNGLDIPLFVDLLLSGGGGDWRQTCAGDLDADGGIDLDDVAAFVACLLE